MKKALIIIGIISSSCLTVFLILSFCAGISLGETDMAIFSLIAAVISIIGGFAFAKVVNKKFQFIRKENFQFPTKQKSFPTKREFPQKVGDMEKAYRKAKYKLNHVAGLPIIEGTVCKVISEFDKITIEAQGAVLSLKKSRITYIGKEKNVVKYAQAVSSVGGAVAGGMLFGNLGAAVGGRAKSKNFQARRQYLVITYLGDDETVKHIVFDYVPKAQMLINDFKHHNKNNIEKRTVEIK